MYLTRQLENTHIHTKLFLTILQGRSPILFIFKISSVVPDFGSLV